MAERSGAGCDATSTDVVLPLVPDVRFERRDAAHLGEEGFTSVEVVHRDGDDDAYFIAAKD
jgi:hypothetical protein